MCMRPTPKSVLARQLSKCFDGGWSDETFWRATMIKIFPTKMQWNESVLSCSKNWSATELFVIVWFPSSVEFVIAMDYFTRENSLSKMLFETYLSKREIFSLEMFSGPDRPQTVLWKKTETLHYGIMMYVRWDLFNSYRYLSKRGNVN